MKKYSERQIYDIDTVYLSCVRSANTAARNMHTDVHYLLYYTNNAHCNTKTVESVKFLTCY